MSTSDVLALMMFAALCGGALGHTYRLFVKVPSWLFSD